MLRAVEPQEKVSVITAVFNEEDVPRGSTHLQKEGTDHLTPQENYLSGASVMLEDGG